MIDDVVRAGYIGAEGSKTKKRERLFCLLFHHGALSRYGRIERKKSRDILIPP